MVCYETSIHELARLYYHRRPIGGDPGPLVVHLSLSLPHAHVLFDG
jgi:hypothetical protein